MLWHRDIGWGQREIAIFSFVTDSSCCMTPQEYFDKATEHVRKCNLCESTSESWWPLAIHDRFGFPVQTKLCTVCGLTFISPRMSQEDYNEFYRSGEYRRLARERTQPYIPLEESQNTYTKIVTTFLGDSLNSWRGSTVLDIGGSTGIFAAALRDTYGLIPTVVDVAELEVALARERGIEGIVGDIPPDRRWNIVCIMQSIDHFLNPKELLIRIRDSILQPGGLLLIDIVDIRMQMINKGLVERVCKFDHPHGFTDATMRAMLDQAGFVIVNSGKSTTAGKVIYVCRRDLPKPGTLPDPRSVIELLVTIVNVRQQQTHDVL